MSTATFKAKQHLSPAWPTVSIEEIERLLQRRFPKHGLTLCHREWSGSLDLSFDRRLWWDNRCHLEVEYRDATLQHLSRLVLANAYRT